MNEKQKNFFIGSGTPAYRIHLRCQLPRKSLHRKPLVPVVRNVPDVPIVKASRQFKVKGSMTTPRQTVPSFRELSQAWGTRKQAKANRSGFSASRRAAKFDRQIRLL